jgi:hypothetical protein
MRAAVISTSIFGQPILAFRCPRKGAIDCALSLSRLLLRIENLRQHSIRQKLTIRRLFPLKGNHRAAYELPSFRQATFLQGNLSKADTSFGSFQLRAYLLSQREGFFVPRPRSL